MECDYINGLGLDLPNFGENSIQITRLTFVEIEPPLEKLSLPLRIWVSLGKEIDEIWNELSEGMWWWEEGGYVGEGH